MAAWPDRRTQTTTESSALDLQRERLIGQLRTECTEGRISLDRFSDLVGDVYAAGSSAELDALRRGLLPTSATAPVAGRPPQRRAPAGRRWVVAIFGQSVEKGRSRLDDDMCAIAAFGDCVVDLTDVTISNDEQAITALSVFGNVTIVVPDHVQVVIEGASVFGSRRSSVDAASLGPGAPVLVIRAWACFGDVRVRSGRGRGR